MSQQQDKINVNMSKELKDYLESAFSPFFERGFMLFEKGGIICKAIESTDANSPSSFGFNSEHIIETTRVMKREGYNYVATYHHHLDSDRQIAFRRNPPLEYKSSYNLGPKYNPDHPSPDDMGGELGNVGFSGADREKPEVQEIIRGVKYLFLGHKTETIPFHIRCYSKHYPSSNELQTGQRLDHYGGFKTVLFHYITYVKTGDRDPTARTILGKYKLRFRVYNIRTGKDNAKTQLKIYLKDNEITMIEKYQNNICKRYVFKNGQLGYVAKYRDNTTKLDKANIEWYYKDKNPEKFTEEERAISKLKEFLTKFTTKMRVIHERARIAEGRKKLESLKRRLEPEPKRKLPYRRPK